MSVSEQPRFVPGVWGPYFGAMLPGLWLNEAGQSATGALIDHVIASHPAVAELKKEVGRFRTCWLGVRSAAMGFRLTMRSNQRLSF